MMVNNKVIGNQYEKQLCELLQKNGYWCYLMSYTPSGQPCDVVAVKDNKVYLIDVKHSSNNKFYASRIEPNQHTCFQYASKKCEVKNCGFAIYSDALKQFYWLNYDDVKEVNILNELGTMEDEISG